ncbi:hypothetical protein PsorP6_017292 [Peronosclerospora sorghi]|uniref:Uncharacterized protein n=1 Tax=Peronosclerospora sorghi TaxID=230839 RepID=A0ACC0WP01_9STRA|nr:hypothetical protein PsorP6_017292 [Peronosclerospora sorghi]
MDLLTPDVKHAFDRVGTLKTRLKRRKYALTLARCRYSRKSAYMHRAHFLHGIASRIPDGVAQFHKRLQDIEKLPTETLTISLRMALMPYTPLCGREVFLSVNDPVAVPVILFTVDHFRQSHCIAVMERLLIPKLYVIYHAHAIKFTHCSARCRHERGCIQEQWRLERLKRGCRRN